MTDVYDLLMDYIQELLMKKPRINYWKLQRLVYEEPEFREKLPWGLCGKYPVSPVVDWILGILEMKGVLKLRDNDMVEMVVHA